MPINFLKRAAKSPSTGEDSTREMVQTMLREIERGGEARVRRFCLWLPKVLYGQQFCIIAITTDAEMSK